MLKLKGSFKGVKNCNEMKKFNITHSTIRCLEKNCFQPKKIMKNLRNNVSINKNSDGYTYYIYHMYDALDKEHKIYYSGRWYNTKFEFDKKTMNEKKQYIKTKTIFENEETLQKYKVEIKIYFNNDGWKKLKTFIET